MVFLILKDIEATSSRLEKEAILYANRSNEVLKQVFFLAYDPFTQFYIRKIPNYRTDQQKTLILSDALSLLSHLSQRVYIGNAAITYLTNILEQCTEPKVIEYIIQKDLRCGASASTANKIWPKLIHEYPCMLCSPSDEKTLAKMKWPAMVQLKMDGMRFNAIVKDGKVDYRSRNGKQIQGINIHLDEYFVVMSRGKDLVFDGELIVKEDGVILDRQTGNGILNKAVKGTITALEASKICATLWDVIDYEDFTNGYSSIPYRDRFTFLKDSIFYDPIIGLVEYEIVSEIAQARKTFDLYLAEGQEGIILKDLNGKWEDKRVKHQLKFKAELDCDLEVIGYEEGTGKYAGMLGALVCRSRSTDATPVAVSIGSGFNDDNRTELWNIRDSLIGKIVAVVYNAKIENKQGGKSLFLPRFIEIREDKEEADSEANIK